MQAYVCLVFNGARVRAFGIEGADDTDALEQAAAVLNSQPSYQTVEIWLGGRLVGKVENGHSESPG